jgi:arylsulfatase A-like enzyme
LSELQEKLDRLALSQKTLIIVVSDHGDRMDATAIEHYRVPLMMVSNTITQPQYINTFLSHRDLPTLLFSSLQGAQSPTPTTDFLLTVGSSEKWIYGMIDLQKHGTFIDNSKGITKKQNGREPSYVHQTFQNYLNEFNSCFLSKQR